MMSVLQPHSQHFSWGTGVLRYSSSGGASGGSSRRKESLPIDNLHEQTDGVKATALKGVQVLTACSLCCW